MTIEIIDESGLTTNLPTIMDQIRDLKVKGIRFNHFDSFKILLKNDKILTIEIMDGEDEDNAWLNVYVTDKPDDTWNK